PADAAVAQAAPVDAAATKKDPVHPVIVHEQHPVEVVHHDPVHHDPVVPDRVTEHTTVVVPVNTNTNRGSGHGISGAGGPEDPYGTDPATDPGDGASAEKKAEFFANLGQQQLIAGDTAGAASNFKKATELDAKNV